MRIVDLIIKKRDGFELSKEEINFFIDKYIRGEVPDYQISSLLMAIFFKGMTFEETAVLTEAMKSSGEVLSFSNIKKLKVDKHSTGGVGDKVSLVVAPIVASLGGVIPMMSGRGLGHTGGTLDKLESIKNYKVFLTRDEIDRILDRCNYVMMGQTDNFVPADRLLYSLRDASGTVESIPLIVSSIMSKKIAEGTNTLVLDLKCGKGAFLKNIQDCEKMASFMLGVASQFGMKMKILITDMNSPLGEEVGNFNEVKESISILSGKKDGRLTDLCVKIAKEMLYISEIEKDIRKCEDLVLDSIKSGRALDYFYKNVSEQNGDIDFLERYNNDDRSLYKNMVDIKAERDGFIEVDAYKVGLASLYIECGRSKKEDSVDHYAGITILKNSGDFVKKGDVIFQIKYNKGDIENAIAFCKNAVTYLDSEIRSNNLVLKELENF